MNSKFLKLEYVHLEALIDQIKASGDVAPPYCWLTETSSTKQGKTYVYVVLVTQPPDRKPKSRSLGRPGSNRHHHWATAIARREAIAELEQQLTLLRALIERQAKTAQLIRDVM
ncbi:MAG TPA: hypothetical protein IGS53_16970 [Leptolyngbyaceae cyanobacterium M33_DOE_097]|uniref:Uncharacterized protein n=1 Tax=Oscillatoriales cyanobacterium SpSt-418 TaxID=2282169 RepID=A0A7C3PI73_9CYAN|nr:hypothetical protein [Leptolyngbyaceae cyanobacterium M33_DOE_097]